MHRYAPCLYTFTFETCSGGDCSTCVSQMPSTVHAGSGQWVATCHHECDVINRVGSTTDTLILNQINEGIVFMQWYSQQYHCGLSSRPRGASACCRLICSEGLNNSIENVIVQEPPQEKCNLQFLVHGWDFLCANTKRRAQELICALTHPLTANTFAHISDIHDGERMS